MDWRLTTFIKPALEFVGSVCFLMHVGLHAHNVDQPHIDPPARALVPTELRRSGYVMSAPVSSLSFALSGVSVTLG